MVTQVDQAWAGLRATLEAERLRIQREIGAYPPPIPACDAYFNFLLEQRALIADELNRLAEAAAACATPDDPARAFETFVRSSRCLTADGRFAVRQST